jgi:hypothetical protein
MAVEPLRRVLVGASPAVVIGRQSFDAAISMNEGRSEDIQAQPAPLNRKPKSSRLAH